MGRTGEFRIMDEAKTRVLISNHVPLRSIPSYKGWSQSEKGDELSNWDPYNRRDPSEFDGEIEYEANHRGYHL